MLSFNANNLYFTYKQLCIETNKLVVSKLLTPLNFALIRLMLMFMILMFTLQLITCLHKQYTFICYEIYILLIKLLKIIEVQTMENKDNLNKFVIVV